MNMGDESGTKPTLIQESNTKTFYFADSSSTLDPCGPVHTTPAQRLDAIAIGLNKPMERTGVVTFLAHWETMAPDSTSVIVDGAPREMNIAFAGPEATSATHSP